ncbi:hypothetical protein DP113_32005 [Brasilonema octagenarum UFV-E1]|uniref:GUN4-like domain-containing protein n=2 Tax=Brasilonema TaxID=383614 RepID=A0A856MKK0_9CYAN|nr:MULTISPECIES: GUN4 domain-containing protein [Brasilonema]NMF66737.1 hypothetical protein [Brasilonema octagenarum UFV-OR1]QDL11893.1 hypothetical protein DP114_31905 [Brasilonema sennae CENA114]QDL18267.1 hypothetical protein DP113_32005 [Brasilonema octagenarum UFV-E1]
MINKIKFFVILTISILCVLLPQIANAINYEQISEIAKKITVLIDGCNSGSGVIYQRQGNTYYVLTAKHIFDNSAVGCLAIAPDGTRYEINSNDVLVPIANVDLAVVSFNSNQDYNLATIGNSQQATSGKNVYVVGAPEPSIAIPKRTTLVVSGNIVGRQSSQEGYELIYNNATSRGMSGGAVLDAQGQLIGIHGQGDRVDKEKTGLNLAIPIETFLKAEIANIPKPISASTPLSSPEPQVEVNYSTLENQLKTLAWKEANDTTVKLMLQLVNRESEGWFTKESLAQLPCEDLKVIDSLWQKYSRYKPVFGEEQSKFGFSVQKTIFEEIVRQQGVRNANAFNLFAQALEWSGGWGEKNYESISYKLDARAGHLPALPGVLPLAQKSDQSIESLRTQAGEYATRGIIILFVGLPGGIMIIVPVLSYFIISIIRPKSDYDKWDDDNEKIVIIVVLVLVSSIVLCFSLLMCFHSNRLQNEATQKHNTLQKSIPTAGSKVLAGIEPLISSLERCEFSKFK